MRYWIHGEDEDFERQHTHELRIHRPTTQLSGGMRIAFFILVGVQVLAVIAVIVVAVVPR